ncbi:MAG: hypothetical protein AB1Z31_19455 [Desulfobacterales bacterium]
MRWNHLDYCVFFDKGVGGVKVFTYILNIDDRDYFSNLQNRHPCISGVKMAASVSMSKLSDEAKGFTVRMLSLMKRAGYSVTEFNPHLIHWLSVTVPDWFAFPI